MALRRYNPAAMNRPGESARMRAVQSPVIAIVADIARRHPGTISLGQGVVYYGPPPQARQRVEEFWRDPENHKYKPVPGIPPLLGLIERKLADEAGVRAGGDGAEWRVVVTAGGNMAFMHAILAITDPGDEVILPHPYYFNQEMAVRIAGCTPVSVPTDANFQLRVDQIERAVTPRTRAVVTISPNNPTGAVYPPHAVTTVNDLCRRRGLFHVSDEAYEYFTWGGARHFSPASIPGAAGHTICLYSMSKAYGFASWRIGYMLIPAHLFEAVRKIQDTILICPPVVSQYAAAGAMEAGRPYCEQHLRTIAKVRHIVREKLDAARDVCEVPPADGAFYFLVRVPTAMTSMALVESLIREFGVAALPGTTFGLEDGRDGCTLRVAYGSLQPETAAEGADRLVRGLRALAGR